MLADGSTSGPFDYLKRGHVVAVAVVGGALVSSILDSRIPVVPESISMRFSGALFSSVRAGIRNSRMMLGVASGVGGRSGVLGTSLRVSCSAVGNVGMRGVPLVVSGKGLAFICGVRSRRGPFVLPTRNNEFRSPFAYGGRACLGNRFVRRACSSLGKLEFGAVDDNGI